MMIIIMLVFKRHSPIHMHITHSYSQFESVMCLSTPNRFITNLLSGFNYYAPHPVKYFWKRFTRRKTTTIRWTYKWWWWFMRFTTLSPFVLYFVSYVYSITDFHIWCSLLIYIDVVYYMLWCTSTCLYRYKILLWWSMVTIKMPSENWKIWGLNIKIKWLMHSGSLFFHFIK